MPQVSQWKEFVLWWEELEPQLLNAARKEAHRYGATTEDSHDVVQDVAVLAVRKYTRFATKVGFKGWALARIHWRMLDLLGSSKQTIDVEDLALSVGPRQEDHTLVHEMFELIQTLPKRQQKVVMLTMQGYSTIDIAHEMGTTIATVRSLRRFGRSRLVALLAKKETAL